MHVSPLTLTINGLTLGEIDSSGGGYPIFNHSGFDFPITRVEVDEYGSTHGAEVGSVLYGKRVMSIDGEIWGEDAQDYEEKRRALAQAVDILNGLQEAEIVTRGGLTVVTDVILNSKPELTYQKNGVIRGPYRLEFASPNPYFSSPDEVETEVLVFEGGGFAIPFAIPFSLGNGGSGQETIVNSGNGLSYPVVRIYGSVINPSLKNETTDQTLSLTYTIPSGSYVELNFKNHTAKLNGITNVLQYVTGDWWGFKPGDNVVKLFGSNASGTAKALFTHQHQYVGI